MESVKNELHPATGTIYTGTMLNGLYHGRGVAEYRNGDVYDGEFKHGLKSGEGIYTYWDGTVYTGSFLYDKKDGYGEIAYKNGDEFKGNFRANFKYKFGTLTMAKIIPLQYGPLINRVIKFEGEWNRNTGVGKIYWENGETQDPSPITIENDFIYDY